MGFRACLNNTWQSHFWSFEGGGFFMFLLLTAIYLEDPSCDLVITEEYLSLSLWDFYRTRYSLA